MLLNHKRQFALETKETQTRSRILPNITNPFLKLWKFPPHPHLVLANIILSFRVYLTVTFPERSLCLPPYAMASVLSGCLCVSFYRVIFLNCPSTSRRFCVCLCLSLSRSPRVWTWSVSFISCSSAFVMLAVNAPETFCE